MVSMKIFSKKKSISYRYEYDTKSEQILGTNYLNARKIR